MFLNIENIEDFFLLLEAEANNKEEKETMPVFVGKNTAINQKTGLCVGEIVLQFQYDTNMVVVFRTSDSIDPVILPNTTLVNNVEYHIDKTTADNVRSKAKSKEDEFNKQMETEYDKAIGVLKAKGFTSIIPGLWI